MRSSNPGYCTHAESNQTGHNKQNDSPRAVYTTHTLFSVPVECLRSLTNSTLTTPKQRQDKNPTEGGNLLKFPEKSVKTSKKAVS